MTALIDNAAAEASDTLARCWGEQTFPVDSFAIATRMGIKVFTADLDNDLYFVGALMDDGIRFLVRKSAPPVLWRWAVAFGLGQYFYHHLVIKSQYPFDVVKSSSQELSGDADSYAQQFALNLLMPQHVLEDVFSQKNNSTISTAAYFGVSLTTLRSRRIMLAKENETA